MPTYLGRFQVGQSVPLALALDVAPDSAPVATITGPGDAPVATIKMSMGSTGGLDWRADYFLGQSPLGTYQVGYSYTVAGTTGSAAGSFDVIAGGDAGGAVISMYAYDRPEARYVVAQLTSGKIVMGRNPRL